MATTKRYFDSIFETFFTESSTIFGVLKSKSGKTIPTVLASVLMTSCLSRDTVGVSFPSSFVAKSHATAS